MTETSIEELLRYEEEPARPRRTGESGVRWWVAVGLAAAALTSVAVFGLRLLDLSASIPVVFACFVALLIVRRLAALVTPPAADARTRTHRRSGGEDGAYRWGGSDGLRDAVRAWHRQLDWADGDPERFARRVHPALRELVDERLRLRHGYTLASDPVRARALLGEQVWNFLAEPPPAGTPTPRVWTTILARLEEI